MIINMFLCSLLTERGESLFCNEDHNAGTRFISSSSDIVFSQALPLWSGSEPADEMEITKLSPPSPPPPHRHRLPPLHTDTDTHRHTQTHTQSSRIWYSGANNQLIWFCIENICFPHSWMFLAVLLMCGPFWLCSFSGIYSCDAGSSREFPIKFLWS